MDDPSCTGEPICIDDPICIDGNEAVARVAYRLHEVIAIYPITPATPMGEWADGWSAEGRPNLWGAVPSVVELQSEGGAAGAVHGALQAGALTTTFTASQGLLLMLPNLYRWAGERLPVVVQVAGRALAAQGLSIFGDHGDVMACRSAGCAILCSASVQEAGDFAAIAMRASLLGRLPFLHLFDGFRTSHEIQKVQPLPDRLLAALMPEQAIAAHRQRALNPARPMLRGTAQNPNVYFQGRETVNAAYAAMPGLVVEAMQQFAALSGRCYRPYEYVGPADAERLVLLMGSACETAEATAERLRAAGERVGVVKVRLFRPFAAALLVEALPASVRAIAVLERCKEPGAGGEPLYLDVVAALVEEWVARHGGLPAPLVLGGRYGLGSKEFTPAMVKAVFDHLGAALGRAAGAIAVPPAPAVPLNHFSVGIVDDLTHCSLPLDLAFTLEGSPGAAPSLPTASIPTASNLPPTLPAATPPIHQALWQPSGAEVRAVVHGLGSDGTVGANKSTIRIIGEATPLFVQGYFVYDSKKAGSLTVSHLRFGPRPIRAPYLIQRPTLVAVHHWDFLERFDPLAGLEAGGLLLINSPWEPAETWRRLPQRQRQRLRQLGLVVWLIDAGRVARGAGMGGRINTVMQVCFFAVAGVLPQEQALQGMRAAIHHRYGRQGEAVVAMNLRALEASLDALLPLDWRRLEAEGELSAIAELDSSAAGPSAAGAGADRLAAAPPFVREVIAPMLAGQGDALPVSAIPADGSWPTGTSRWEKRNIAEMVPLWDSELCVQCGKCVLVCPHAVIRAKVATPQALAAAPPQFRQAPARDPAFAGQQFTIQVSSEDCTGCELCVVVCPARDRAEPKRKALAMVPQRPLRQQGRRHWEFFLGLPEVPRAALNLHKVAQQQLQQPLFEFSGACAGCGETPYLKLASQLFGDRLLMANATGCSSIYGGSLPTTPWSTNAEGRGPAWSNSLFEDNAEFGYGMRVALDQQRAMAVALLQQLPELPAELVGALVGAADQQGDEPAIYAQRGRLEELKRQLRAQLEALPAEARAATAASRLLAIADALVKTSVWLVGGDGWAYDIGFGGLDHVLAAGRDVNALVLDTELYSNTGGQASKATPMGAVAKFAAGGKAAPKKDLGLMAISYGTVYVASVAMGARDEHTIRAFLEAESYPGPSLILAYSHCIAHGIAMEQGMAQQHLAVASGRWPLYRYDPRRAERGANPLQLDSPPISLPLAEAMATEHRFRLLRYSQPQRAEQLAQRAQAACDRRWALLRAWADIAQAPG
jgi:pyruvate-ferredoxin/flavodoxin oxidoreductase